MSLTGSTHSEMYQWASQDEASTLTEAQIYKVLNQFTQHFDDKVFYAGRTNRLNRITDAQVLEAVTKRMSSEIASYKDHKLRKKVLSFIKYL